MPSRDDRQTLHTLQTFDQAFACVHHPFRYQPPRWGELPWEVVGMNPRWSRPKGEDWASRLGPECGEHEDRVARAIGRPAVVRCDRDRDELVVEVLNLHPNQLDAVADELSGLWPGFLAPAGVSLRVVDGELWDNEAMALRSFDLRRGDA